jgi:hypothetical protein
MKIALTLTSCSCNYWAVSKTKYFSYNKWFDMFLNSIQTIFYVNIDNFFVTLYFAFKINLILNQAFYE